MKIGILLDSSATPNPSIFDGTSVEVLPLHINLSTGEDFLDTLENCKKYKVLDLVEQDGDVKTSQASPGELEVKYSEMLKKYDHIYHIPIANNLSSMLQTSLMVSKDDQFEGKVTVFFTEKITATVIERAALIINEKINNKEIKTIEQIDEFMNEYSRDSFVSFIPGSLKRMAVNGRAKTLLVSVLSFMKAKVVIKWGAKPTKEGVFRTYSSMIERIIEIYQKDFGGNYNFLFLRSSKFKEKNTEIIINALKAKKINFEEQVIPNIFLVHGGVESLSFLICKK